MSKAEFVLPTNPEDQKRIERAIHDISAQLSMIKDRQENIKEVKTDLKDRYEMPLSLVGKLVKAHFEQKYEEMTAEAAAFELVYETLFGDATDESDD